MHVLDLMAYILEAHIRPMEVHISYENDTPSVLKYLSLLIFFATLTIRLIQKIIANM
jgi:hypothetical protein